MSFSFGHRYKITLFGESHGQEIGVVIEGLPAGFKPDLVYLEKQLNRRKAGQNGTTSRVEADQPQFVAGLFEGHTTLAPLVVIFQNSNKKSEDYEPLASLMRAGQADYPAYIKSHGYHDYRGGGSFSARLTAPLVVAGSLARQVLQEKGIMIGSQVTQVGMIKAPLWQYPEPSLQNLSLLDKEAFPVANPSLKKQMEAEMEKATADGESLGGQIELAVLGLPVGLGNPFFDSLESIIAHLLFSVPSVKAVEFGEGLALAGMKGSEANDLLEIRDQGSGIRDQYKKISIKSNHQGGINGGLSNGNPLIVRATLRPPASHSKSYSTINMKTGQNEVLTLKGRHDCCPTRRASVVLESALAVALASFLFN